MKAFMEPQIEVKKFSVEDVITTSTTESTESVEPSVGDTETERG